MCLLYCTHFNLLIGCNCAEYNFAESLSREHSETDATYYSLVFDESQGFMLPDNNKRSLYNKTTKYNRNIK